jgi:type IV secretory pathway VirB10-like protein
MRLSRVVLPFCVFLFFCLPAALAQTNQDADSDEVSANSAPASCPEIPRDDALPSLCTPPSLDEEEARAARLAAPTLVKLNIPNGTPLRIALDQRTRISHEGELVHGLLVESVYAFDQAVIPAGTIATGHVAKVAPVPGTKRALSYANGNFSPFHKYEVKFDTLTLPNGKQMAIQTTVSPGTADVVHLVSHPQKEAEQHKGRIAQAAADAKDDAERQARDAIAQVTTPGRMHRLKEFLFGRLPYHRQYLDPGTRFNAELAAPLDFGATSRTREQLADIGNAPAPDSLLHARLVAEVSSATAVRGTPIAALLTEPLYSADHHLLLPANSRLVGEVVQAKAAQKLHHNGELRVVFERIETPEGTPQLLQGSLEGVEVDRAANMKLDEEGGARTTDSKKRYLSTGITILLAAAASHPDAEHGTTDAAGDPAVRTGAGDSGFGLVGAMVSLAAKSTPVSMGFAAYGASTSIYSNFLSRGRDVVFPKDTPMEISFGNPHPAPAQPKSD